jgi:hypothetical protein
VSGLSDRLAEHRPLTHSERGKLGAAKGWRKAEGHIQPAHLTRAQRDRAARNRRLYYGGYENRLAFATRSMAKGLFDGPAMSTGLDRLPMEAVG